MKRIPLFSFAAALALGTANPAFADFTIEGDMDALTVNAQDAPRSEIVAGIVERFSLEATGEAIQDGAVSGLFWGDLGQVLQAIAPDNGYAIAYVDGRPTRITFTSGRAGPPAQHAAPAAARNDAPAAAAAAPSAQTAATAQEENDTPSVQRILRRQVQSATPSLPQASNAPQPQSEADIAEMTRRAMADLEALTRELQQTRP